MLLRVTSWCVLVAALACGGPDREGEEPAVPRAGEQARLEEVPEPPPTATAFPSCELPEMTAVVTSEAEWRRLHALMFACTSQRPEPPPVDFARDMLLVLSTGMRPTGGYAANIPHVERDGATLTVGAAETRPGPGCVTTQSLTYPVAIARVPRVDVPAAFARTVVTRDCPM